MPIDPVIINAARHAIEDQMAWAAVDIVSPWQGVEVLHTHRVAARLEAAGWHGYPENQFDNQTPGATTDGDKWNRADLYAAKADENTRLWMEVKRMGLSADGRTAGNARYPTADFKKHWARDLHRILVGPKDYPGWTTWRLFYLVVCGVSDPALFTALPTGAARDTGDQLVGEGLDTTIRKLVADGTALDLLRGLIEAARDRGLDVEPVLPAPLECGGAGYWYPLMFGWSTEG